MTETKTKIEKTTRRPLGARRRTSFLGGWRLFMRLLVLMVFVGLLGLWANASQARAPSSAGDGAAAPAELIFRVMSQTAPPQRGAEGGANEPREIAPASPIPALALSTRVSTIITGHIVRTTVIQAFKNPTNDWVEGVYYFPLPDNAAVDRMVLKIGDRVIQSEIQEKQQAVKTYNRAAAAGKTAALLEQYRPNTFSTRVANVEPASLVTVEISFQTLATQDGASFSHLMPQIITPRYTPAGAALHAVNETPAPNTDIPAAVNGDLRAQTEFTILLRGGAKFSNLRSVTHLIETQPLDNGDVVITLTGGKLPADKDFRLDWSLAPGAAAKTLLFEEVQGDDRYLLGILLPPMASDDATIRPRDVTFILDISGSMQGAGIDQGRQALIAALDLLRPEDRFQIIVFNDQFAQSFDHAVPASNGNVEKARVCPPRCQK